MAKADKLTAVAVAKQKKPGRYADGGGLYFLREEVCDDLRRQGVQIRPQTIANTDGPITKFRPVSHLWAAYIHEHSNGENVFPCLAKNVETFLGLAEAIRDIGENTFTAHAKRPVIVPGETVKLPRGIVPAKVDFDFGRVSFTGS